MNNEVLSIERLILDNPCEVTLNEIAVLYGSDLKNLSTEAKIVYKKRFFSKNKKKPENPLWHPAYKAII